MEIFNLRKLNGVEIEDYPVETSNRFAALENLGDNADANRAW
jgi:hypothetical protein